MSDIVKVTEEEFDEEGNLVRRTITEYTQEVFRPGKDGAPPTLPWSPGPQVGDVWPYGHGQIVTNPEKYTTWNQYDHGSFHSHRQGGTDRDVNGVVVS